MCDDLELVHPRNDLKEECDKLKLGKTGSVQHLKEPLVRHKLGQLQATELEEYTKIQSPKASAPSSSASAPSEAVAAAACNEPGDASQPELLFGRQTFKMPFAEEEDRTGFFSNMEGALDASAPNMSKSYLEMIEEGEDGVIPVAAMVKIMQGMHDAHYQIAVLLAGMVVGLLCKFEGQCTQCSSVFAVKAHNSYVTGGR